jgi:hypothetical protein
MRYLHTKVKNCIYAALVYVICMRVLFVLQTREGTEYMMLTPDRCLIFPSVDYVRNLVTKHGTKQGMFPVVIDCSHIYGADFTAARVSRALKSNRIINFNN